MEEILMGLGKQLIRSVKKNISNVFEVLTRRKGSKKARDQEPIELHRSWQPGKGKPNKSEQLIRIKYKRRLPGLKKINRFVAGIWLFMNFVFSQFLLGSIGSQAQWVFFFFLGNCYFIAKYLWGSRKDERKKTEQSSS